MLRYSTKSVWKAVREVNLVVFVFEIVAKT